MIVRIIKANSKTKFAPVAWLIKLFQRTKYSHYAIAYHDGINEMIIDSTGFGVRLQTKHNWQKHYTIYQIKEIEIEETVSDFREWSHMHLGKGYGFLQIVGLLFIILGLIKNNPFGKESQRLICNELVLSFLVVFRDLEISDSDNYDMNATSEILHDIR